MTDYLPVSEAPGYLLISNWINKVASKDKRQLNFILQCIAEMNF